MVNGMSTDEVPISTSVKEVLTIRNSEEWRTSMQKELEAYVHIKPGHLGLCREA